MQPLPVFSLHSCEPDATGRFGFLVQCCLNSPGHQPANKKILRQCTNDHLRVQIAQSFLCYYIYITLNSGRLDEHTLQEDYIYCISDPVQVYSLFTPFILKFPTYSIISFHNRLHNLPDTKWKESRPCICILSDQFNEVFWNNLNYLKQVISTTKGNVP